MTFKYKPYYEYKPTKSNILADELSPQEIERNITLLMKDLESHFSEIGGFVRLSYDGIISVETDLTQDECDSVVASYLSSLQLFARKVLPS